MAKRERFGTIKAHHFSGRIREVHTGSRLLRDVRESEADAIIARLPKLAEGSFYAFHATRFAKPYELEELE